MEFEVLNCAWDGLCLPGVVTALTQARSSEDNLRNLYRRWAEFMEVERWEELATWRRPAHAERGTGFARNRAIPTTRFPRRHSRANGQGTSG
jgi:hypothetical protein